MFKRFLKGFLAVVLVAGIGFASGYYSDVVLKKIVPPDKLSKLENYIKGGKDKDRPDTEPGNGETGATGASGDSGEAGSRSEPDVTGAPGDTAPDLAGNRYPAAGLVQELQDTDLGLGGLKIGDNRSQVEKIIGRSVKVHKSYDRQIGQNVRAFENGRLTVEWGKKTGVFSIAAASPGIVTARGLQVGDPMVKAYQLYGRPASDQGGLAAYKYPKYGAEALLIKYTGDKVTEIKIATKKVKGG